jgi:hypothetical protein
VENLNIYPRMRKLHEQLKLMRGASACDRYPFLKELKELDENLRKNWDEYDGFVIAPEGPAGETPENNPGVTPENNPPAVISDIKEISAARKYLSDNKTRLAALRIQEDQSEYLALLEKMQKRLALLIKAGAGVSEGQLAELKELGLDVQ